MQPIQLIDTYFLQRIFNTRLPKPKRAQNGIDIGLQIYLRELVMEFIAQEIQARIAQQFNQACAAKKA